VETEKELPVGYENIQKKIVNSCMFLNLFKVSEINPDGRLKKEGA